jgi:hypothetical protein
MYNMEDYLKLLEGLRVEDDLPETVDADDLALLFEAMAGAFDELDLNGGGGDGEIEPDEIDDDAPSGAVKMVQLFLDTETHPLFMEAVEKLTKQNDAGSLTECVFQTVTEAAGL